MAETKILETHNQNLKQFCNFNELLDIRKKLIWTLDIRTQLDLPRNVLGPSSYVVIVAEGDCLIVFINNAWFLFRRWPELWHCSFHFKSKHSTTFALWTLDGVIELKHALMFIRFQKQCATVHMID